MAELARRRTSPLTRFEDEMGDLFSRVFQDWPAGGIFQRGTWWPAVDLAEREDSIVVRAEVPGMKAEDIDISVQGNMLCISGEKKSCEEEERKDENYYHVERRYGAFRRDITLPSEVDADKIKAEYHDGVLSITMPKSEAARPRKIKVES